MRWCAFAAASLLALGCGKLLHMNPAPSAPVSAAAFCEVEPDSAEAVPEIYGLELRRDNASALVSPRQRFERLTRLEVTPSARSARRSSQATPP